MELRSRRDPPVRPVKTSTRRRREEAEEEEPLSPVGRMFHAPAMNLTVVAVMGFKGPIDVAAFKQGLRRSILRHPRFSSNLAVDEINGGNPMWVRATVDLDKHVTVVPRLEPTSSSPEDLLGDYISAATKSPLDPSRPLWEVHLLLNLNTPDAGSAAVFRIHHSLGDGASLMSVVLACSRLSSDPESLPALPAGRRGEGARGVWWILMVLRMVWNSFFDLAAFLATVWFLRDSESPVKGGCGDGSGARRFVHRIVRLEDVKVVKEGLDDATVNDVLLGVTQAGLTRYLNRKLGDAQNDQFLANLRVRATVMVNIRPAARIQDIADMMDDGAKAKWGNQIGYIVLPFAIGLQDDPLEYVRSAKAMIDRKKLLFEAACSYSIASLVIKLFGAKVAAAMCRRVVANTTLAFSNIIGPREEVDFYGHPVTYIAPSVYGHPHALTFHYQSYAGKMIISLTVDPDVISDPYRLCDDLEESLRLIKHAVATRKGPKRDTT